MEKSAVHFKINDILVCQKNLPVETAERVQQE